MTYTTNAFAHGIGNSAVSSQWYNRPDDQKFLSLDDMLAYKKVDAGRMTSRIVDTHKMKIVGDFDEQNPSRGNVFVEYADDQRREHNNTPTNWSFNQLSQLAGAPAGYLKDLPAPIAAECLEWGLKYNRGKELIKVYGHEAPGGELRAATGPDYGRIFDWEILEPIKNLIEESGGRWKVPGMMTGSRNGMAVYDPEIPVSMDTTTLFASDRDVFVFLVDDRNPIEVGKLANGEPDLMFRGFYAWNTKFAPDRFAMEARPALQSFANGSTHSFVEGVQAAKDAKIAKDDESRLEFLTKRAGLSGRMAKAAAARHLKEEGRPVETVWDAAQAITAIARDVPHQDARIEVERKAGALLDKVTA